MQFAPLGTPIKSKSSFIFNGFGGSLSSILEKSLIKFITSLYGYDLFVRIYSKPFSISTIFNSCLQPNL